MERIEIEMNEAWQLQDELYDLMTAIEDARDSLVSRIEALTKDDGLHYHGANQVQYLTCIEKLYQNLDSIHTEVSCASAYVDECVDIIGMFGESDSDEDEE